METKKTFETHDLYLSAALKICGFRLLDLKKDSKGKGLFVWEDKPERPQYVRNYFSGVLEGSLKAYVDAWSSLKSLLIESD
jgi:hypothetical protein